MSTRERIMEQINAMPEEDIIRMWNMWDTLLWVGREIAQDKQVPSSWDVLRKYRGGLHVEDNFDYKTELARYRDERYSNPG